MAASEKIRELIKNRIQDISSSRPVTSCQVWLQVKDVMSTEVATVGDQQITEQEFTEQLRGQLERMRGLLESLGYTPADERGSADLIVFNTCTIREKADERLVQHLENFEEHRGVLHPVSVVADSRVAAAMCTTEPLAMSYHHQAIDTPADSLRVIATAADGTIEAVEHRDRRWVVGVQWHPEDTAHEDPANQGLFDAVVEAARR